MTVTRPYARVALSSLLAVVVAAGACSKGGSSQTASAPSRGTWARFVAEGRGFTAPPSWTVTDPIAGKQEPNERGWCRALPAASTAAARVTAPQGTTSALVLHGPSSELGRFVESCFAARRADLEVKFDETFRTTTAGGAQVVVQVGHREPTNKGEPPTTWLLGQASRGDRMLVVDAGGVATSFDRPAVMTLIGSVTF
ncbi:MAG: hypothetical protein IPK07_12535 [Deltaproteobacteria bacterium]|jgi:hypothetical protein|nr:hypothetical protein [Deltaproteobacteria bacterium]